MMKRFTLKTAPGAGPGVLAFHHMDGTHEVYEFISDDRQTRELVRWTDLDIVPRGWNEV
jgi:hypothetical protein